MFFKVKNGNLLNIMLKEQSTGTFSDALPNLNQIHLMH